MDRVAAANYVTVGGKRKFADKNLGTNTPGTSLGEQWFNGAQEVLLLAAEAFGIALSHGDDTQLLTALRLASGNNQRSLTANTTLTVADAGMITVSAAGGNVTLTLPAANAAGGKPFPLVVLRTDTSANTVTVARAGSDVIWPGAQTSVGVLPLQAVALRSDGASTWHRLSAPSKGMQVFSTSGTFTVPAGVTEVEVEVWGAGGGSSGSSGAGVYTNGGGGGGYARKIVSGLAPGGTVAVTIGAGGTASASGVVGGTGGTSSFGAHCSATGGAGSPTASGLSAAAGDGAGGDLNLSGSLGGAAIPSAQSGHGGPSAIGGQVAPGGQSWSNAGVPPGGGASGAGGGLGRITRRAGPGGRAMGVIRIKRGETLLVQIKGQNDDNTDADLTNVTLTAEVRTTLGALVASLPIVKDTVDLSAASITEPATGAWPIGTHRCDFKAVIAGAVAYSETFNIQVGWPITA